MAQTYEQLKLKNQLCFPLYACARKITNAYTPYLKPLGLTYTQYIVFMVLWEKEEVNVGELGRLLKLDAGTLTPMDRCPFCRHDPEPLVVSAYVLSLLERRCLAGLFRRWTARLHDSFPLSDSRIVHHAARP